MDKAIFQKILERANEYTEGFIKIALDSNRFYTGKVLDISDTSFLFEDKFKQQRAFEFSEIKRVSPYKRDR